MNASADNSWWLQNIILFYKNLDKTILFILTFFCDGIFTSDASTSLNQTENI